MPCLCPRPERGMSTAAMPGSSRCIAMPVGTSALSPGRSVIGSSMQARRSRPAEPPVAYAGSCARIFSSRILMSSFFMEKCSRSRGRGSGRDRLGDLLEVRDVAERALAREPHRVRDDAVRDLRLRRAREGMRALVVVDRDLVLFLAD